MGESVPVADRGGVGVRGAGGPDQGPLPGTDAIAWHKGNSNSKVQGIRLTRG